MTDDHTTSYTLLDSRLIVEKIELLSRRIDERFPSSGLCNVSEELLKTARKTQAQVDWVSSPIRPIRYATRAVSVIIALAFLAILLTFEVPEEGFRFLDLAAHLETTINVIVLLGAAAYFLVSTENRVKRSRALDALNVLRSIAHVIDMHQLTKDPERLLKRGKETTSSPNETMSAFELSRYLDYSSEMLALSGKLAALYINNFDDPVVLASVNEIEMLTSGLSRKIWQKLMILHSLPLDAVDTVSKKV